MTSKSPKPDRRPDVGKASWRPIGVTIASLVLAGCGEPGPVGGIDDPGDDLICNLDINLLVTQVAPDAIPSLLQPDMVTIGAPGSEYVLDSDRVLGVIVDGQPRAYPHAILDHHEIVSDRVGDTWLLLRDKVR